MIAARSNGRKWLAEQTRQIHEDLHAHPLMGKLTDPAITPPTYRAALRVFQSAFGHIEAQRSLAGHHPHLSLTREVAALKIDIGPPEAACSNGPLIDQSDRDCLLGALYTAHGSAFGAAVMAKHIARTLPQAPITYLSLPHDITRWRQLVSAVDALSDDKRRGLALLEGASSVFEHVRALADAHWAALSDVSLADATP